MGTIKRESKKWVFRDLRWDGFGLVPGLLGSALISFDALRIITLVLALIPSPFAPFIARVTDWLRQDFDFLTVLILSALLAILATLRTRFLLKAVGTDTINNEDPRNRYKKLLHLANFLALYTFSVMILSLVSYDLGRGLSPFLMIEMHTIVLTAD